MHFHDVWKLGDDPHLARVEKRALFYHLNQVKGSLINNSWDANLMFKGLVVHTFNFVTVH